MKKIIVMIIFCISFALAINIQADEYTEILSQRIECTSGSKIKIPIEISNNLGIMGFKIIVKYDSKKIKIISVENGKIISHGMFQYKVREKQNDVVILWTGTEDMVQNGELFLINAEIKSGFVGNMDMLLSYSQEDTFNEKWKDVKLATNPILIHSKSNKEKQTISEQPDVTVEELVDYIVANVDEDYIIENIDKVIKENGINDIEDLEQRNWNIKQSVTKKIINNIISNKRVSKRIKKYTKELIKKSRETNVDLVDRQMDIVKELYNNSTIAKEKKTSKEIKDINIKEHFNIKKQNNNIAIYITISVVGIMILAAGLFYRNRKHKRK